MKIATATTGDIEVIRNIAHLSWQDAYRDILSPQQLKYMLNKIYSPDALEQQFRQGQEFLIASRNDVALGFASFGMNNPATLVYKLHKLYVLTGEQNSGVGKTLLTEVIKRVNEQSGSGLLLNVNRNNRAIAFYSKMGFSIIGEEDIDIGEGYFMNDYIMQLPVN